MIRPARPDDAAALAVVYAPYVMDGVVSFEIDPPDAAEMTRRMAAGKERHPWLVAEGDGRVLGYAYASVFRGRAAYDRAVETTLYVTGHAHGRGVGRALYRELLARLTEAGFAQAVAIIALPNDRSVRLHERLGFALVGVNPAIGWKHGRWIDVGMWQRALGPPDASAGRDRPEAPTASGSPPRAG